MRDREGILSDTFLRGPQGENQKGLPRRGLVLLWVEASAQLCTAALSDAYRLTGENRIQCSTHRTRLR